MMGGSGEGGGWRVSGVGVHNRNQRVEGMGVSGRGLVSQGVGSVFGCKRSILGSKKGVGSKKAGI